MAGFAVNLKYLAQYPNATMPYKAGYEEDAFLRSINLKIDDIEPKANDCTEVYGMSLLFCKLQYLNNNFCSLNSLAHSNLEN